MPSVLGTERLRPRKYRDRALTPFYTRWILLGISLLALPVMAEVANLRTPGQVVIQHLKADGDEYWDDQFGAVGIDGNVRDIVVYHGDLIVGGAFSSAGGVVTQNIARWDGTSWAPLGVGLSASVRSLAVLDDDLFAGWNGIEGVSKWDGTAWTPVGSFAYRAPASLTAYDGKLIAGGDTYLQCWDGLSWSEFGSGVSSNVNDLLVMGTDLIVGGDFGSIGGIASNYIARWDGTSWHPIGSGARGRVSALGVYGDSLVAAGEYTVEYQDAYYIESWDGHEWSPLGLEPDDWVWSVAGYGSDLIVGGRFTAIGGISANSIARWDGGSWTALGSGTDSFVSSIALDAPDLYVGGYFMSAGGKPSNHIARWNEVLGPCDIEVTHPSDGDSFCTGMPIEIQWTYSGDCGIQVCIELMSDGVLCQQLGYSVENDGSFTWSPEGCSGEVQGYSIRITDQLYSGSTSDGGLFSIMPAAMPTVISPNGGEHLIAGEQTDLTWAHSSCSGSSVRLELLIDGTVCTVLADSTDNDGSYSWSPTPCGETSEGYRLRITDLASGHVDESDSDFVMGPAFRILAVSDVGPDQGGQVRVQWHHQDHDQFDTGTTITQYSVWRRVEDGSKTDAGLTPPPDNWALAYPPGAWDYITSVPAGGEELYGTVCPTLCDSTAEHGPCWSVFFVRAHTPEPLVFFDTLPDSGYSSDDIAPSVPAGLAVAYGSQNVLTWHGATEADFRNFHVYRGATTDFVADPGCLVAQTTDPEWTDPSGSFGSYYQVSAVDYAGNESEAARPTVSTGVQEVPTRIFSLHQNFPNPFNPSTKIEFELPARVDVTLRIYDVSGRLIRTLLNNIPTDAGRHQVMWDGADSENHRVSTGLYFYHLKAGESIATKRMMLIQ